LKKLNLTQGEKSTGERPTAMKVDWKKAIKKRPNGGQVNGRKVKRRVGFWSIPEGG